MKRLGPAVIDGNLNELTTALKSLLDRKTRCFGTAGASDDEEEFEEEQEEEEDDEDTNETVFEAITDIIP